MAAPPLPKVHSGRGNSSVRLVRNAQTLVWGKESSSPRRAVLPLNDAATTQGEDKTTTSALQYFLSTSPRQPVDQSVSKLLYQSQGGEPRTTLTVKVVEDIGTFEKRHPMSDDESSDDFALSMGASSPVVPRRNGIGKSGAGKKRDSVIDLVTSPVQQLGVSSGLGTSTSAAGLFSQATEGGVGLLQSGTLLDTTRPHTPPTTVPQEYLPGKRVPVVSSNPVTGVLCNVPLYKVFQAYKDHFTKAVRARRVTQAVAAGGLQGGSVAAPPAKKEPMRITTDDFVEMLKVLLPAEDANRISRDYAKRMVEPFGTPAPYGGVPKVLFPAVFSYLCKCFGHMTVERNIRFILRVLDPRGKGGIPYSVLTARVIRAWSENRVVGGAIYAWRALATALETSGDIDVRLLENPALIAKDELRMIAYTTAELTEVMSTQDLECDLTSTPRFPFLPQATTTRDETSSGGKFVAKHSVL